ncbi:MAG: proton-conducting transporter membrane subunit [Pirellulaceae bacterium]
MNQLLLVLLSLPILGLLACITLPSRVADKLVRSLRPTITWIVAVQFGLGAAAALAAISSGGAIQLTLLSFGSTSAIDVGLYVDGIAGLMLVMVSIVGFTVCRYSVRYLDGEATQGRYFRWLGFTMGAVSLMVVSGNLLLFFLAWVSTSMGLHQLLLHYRHRQAAHHAAWTKFAISRLGDAFLIAAFLLAYRAFGTLDLSQLFEQASALSESSRIEPIHSTIGWFIVLGAITKSAQFPFHTWLPQTMETPTPVSALMHAGIVNAGGYLIIRTSPLVALAPEALIALAIIGAFTAVFGGIVMMTQPSIKRALAYSTVAQMGFMMLQCGLGAFSAAMLHILAHSFYKAYAFLSSGSVIQQRIRTTPKPSNSSVGWSRGGAIVLSILMTSVAFGAASWVLALDLNSKAGGLLLAFTFCIALVFWLTQALRYPTLGTVSRSLAGSLGLCFAYVAAYQSVDFVVAPLAANIYASNILRFVMFDIFLAFCALFLLSLAVNKSSTPDWLEAWRIHAMNGFYVDTIYRRWMRSAVRG